MSKIYIGKAFDIKTINDGLKIAKTGDVLILSDDTYYEKVVVNTAGLTIEGNNNSRIVYDDYALKIHEDGREYITFRTYTMLIKAPNVTLNNLTIENSAGYGPTIGQAVALSLYNTNIHINNCTLLGKQDTLFIGPFSKDLEERYVDLLPIEERISEVDYYSYFNNCVICGNVDFIFGGGNATFNKCKIISLPTISKTSWVTAPCHNKENKHGFIFNNCEFLRSINLIDEKVYLGRPWRDYGFITFNNCYLDKHIDPKGFDVWNDTDRHLHARFYENDSYGPGKNIKDRIEWSKVK